MSAARWAGASAVHRGASHIRSGLPCQDAVGVAWAGLPVVAAVADGLGSASQSDAGAEVAVATAIHLLESRFVEFRDKAPALIAEAIVSGVVERIEEMARSNGSSRHQFATTLMFVATDGHTLIAGNLGDGVVSRQDRDGKSKVLFRPRRGEHVNETFPITSSGAAAHMQVMIEPVADATGFALFTDGSAEALYQRQRDEIAPAVDTLLSWLDVAPPHEVSAALTRSLSDVVSEKTSDDCSIAILRRVELLRIGVDKQSVRACMISANPRSRTHFLNRWRSFEFWDSASPGTPAGMSQSTYRRHVEWLNRNIVRDS